MTEAQIQLQNALTTTFLANLAFLSEYDNDLYHKVDELSRMIENGTYQEKYALEFNMQDGEFDIYDIVHNKYLYNKQPKKINDDLVRKIEFDDKQSIFNIEQIFFNNELFNIDLNNRFNFNIEENLAYTSNQMQDYKTITKNFLINKKLAKIKKFIFLGTLLGRHIPRIAKKVNAEIYFILEKNLEIFRLSLFTIDYTILAKKQGVIFSIMDDEITLEKKIFLFLNNLEYDNYLLKFSTTNINIDDFVSKLLGLISTNKPTIYDYHRKLYTHFSRTLKLIKENYNFLQFEDIRKNFEYFKTMPVLFIAAGPSLDQNIDWIKENQNKFLIICIGSILKKLLDNNIRVDIITTLDEKEILIDAQFHDDIIKKIPKHTLLFASSITHKDILKKFDKNKIFIFEIYDNIYTNNIAFNGFSIGEVTLNILLELNTKNIYIIGLDLALNQETGESHSKGSNSQSNTYNLNEQDRAFFGLKDSTLKVKGYNECDIITSSTFYLSINFLNQEVLINKKDDVKIYNLSSNGAYLLNTTYMDKNDIDTKILKSINISNLSNIFISFSNNVLDNFSKENAKYDCNNLKNIKKSFLINSENYIYTDFEDFLVNYLECFHKELLKLKHKHIYLIVKNYYMFVIPYLKYYFNNKKSKEETKKVYKIKNIFIYHMNKLIDDYILCLENIIKEQ